MGLRLKFLRSRHTESSTPSSVVIRKRYIEIYDVLHLYQIAVMYHVPPRILAHNPFSAMEKYTCSDSVTLMCVRVRAMCMS